MVRKSPSSTRQTTSRVVQFSSISVVRKSTRLISEASSGRRYLSTTGGHVIGEHIVQSAEGLISNSFLWVVFNKHPARPWPIHGFPLADGGFPAGNTLPFAPFIEDKQLRRAQSLSVPNRPSGQVWAVSMLHRTLSWRTALDHIRPNCSGERVSREVRQSIHTPRWRTIGQAARQTCKQCHHVCVLPRFGSAAKCTSFHALDRPTCSKAQ